MKRRSLIAGLLAGIAAPVLPKIPTAAPIVSQSFETYTFKKANKFFDVVTYTGNGTAPIVDLGWTPAAMIVKSTSEPGNWLWIDATDKLPDKPNTNYVAYAFSDKALENCNVTKL